MNNYDHQIVTGVREHLTDDLRNPEFKGHACPTAGHCYVASFRFDICCVGVFKN